MDSTEPPATPTALYTNIASLAAPVANGPCITTKTAIVVMAAATTARTALAAKVVVALLARPPPPLVPMAGSTHRDRPTTTCGRGT
jgi:hypothetical protein